MTLKPVMTFCPSHSYLIALAFASPLVFKMARFAMLTTFEVLYRLLAQLFYKASQSNIRSCKLHLGF